MLENTNKVATIESRINALDITEEQRETLYNKLADKVGNVAWVLDLLKKTA